MKSYRSARDVLAAVERAIAGDKPVQHTKTLQEITRILHDDRHYFWVGIYLVMGKQAVRAAFRGPEAEQEPCASIALGRGNVGSAAQDGRVRVVPDVSADQAYLRCFHETTSEIATPIKIAGRVIGVLDAESDQMDAFGGEDRVLLKNVAGKLALFLTGKGKYIVRKFREGSAQPAEVRGYQPSSERPMERSRKVAAGENPR
ncbi:MAG: GAF domain-containing protein [Acidobacteriia bacterium]|nr:GAF domain-containing protein [Terriglobia bacterium]